MKKIYNYTFRAVCIYIVMLIAFVYVTTGFSVETFDRNVLNANVTKELNSVLLSQKQQYVCQVENEQISETTEADVTKEEEEEQELVVPLAEEVVQAPISEATPVPETKPSYVYTQTIDTTNLPVLATTSGNVSHYGHDCYGCTLGKTATGYDISDGRIYYTDSTYGSVRIVAAGNEYPFGTILRLSNASTSPIIAIVLDRGGAIGQGRRYFLDLLTESEAAANQAGVKYNMTIEVLRMGY
ncbi:MAG: hypothetical protein K2I72_03910 [Bacilli bacterium]|nr:hypothetical protein [Bacilli bacterium]